MQDEDKGESSVIYFGCANPLLAPNRISLISLISLP